MCLDVLDQMRRRVRHAACCAGRTDASAFAREGNQDLVVARLAADAGEAVGEDAATQVLGCRNAGTRRARARRGEAGRGRRPRVTRRAWSGRDVTPARATPCVRACVADSRAPAVVRRRRTSVRRCRPRARAGHVKSPGRALCAMPSPTSGPAVSEYRTPATALARAASTPRPATARSRAASAPSLTAGRSPRAATACRPPRRSRGVRRR